MSSFYQILVAVGGGVVVLAAVIKASPIVFKAIKGLVVWADVQHDVHKAITETLPAVEQGHAALLDETKLLRSDLAEHVALESGAIALILNTAKRTDTRVGELESAITAKAHTQEILEAVTVVHVEQLKQNGTPDAPED